MSHRHLGHSALASSEGLQRMSERASAAKPREEESSRRGQWGMCHWKEYNKRESDLEKQAVTMRSQSPPGLLRATGCLLNVTSPPLVCSSRSRMKKSHSACLNVQLARDLLQTGVSSSISYPAVYQGQLNPGLRPPCHLALCTNKNSLEHRFPRFLLWDPGAAWSANGHSGQ